MEPDVAHVTWAVFGMGTVGRLSCQEGLVRSWEGGGELVQDPQGSRWELWGGWKGSEPARGSW